MSASGKSAPAAGGVRRLSGFRRWRGPYPLLLSLLLGVLIWGYVDSRRMVVEEFEVPLQIQIPAGWEMQQAPAEVVKVHQRVLVTVLDVDHARGRISLSLKER